MRIVGGKYRGRIFHPGKNFKARPTTDLAKEGLFNILTNRFDFSEIEILDLFSGTGSISYEFASRGCNKITCVESDFIHFKFIKQTIEQLQTNSIEAIRGDVFIFLKKNINKFDLVFADPPFDFPGIEKIPETVINSQVLKPDAIFIMEHSKKIMFHDLPEFIESRKYGSVNFSFFKKSKTMSNT